MSATAVITVPGTITTPTLGKSYRDTLLDSANGGVKYLFDTGKSFSFPAQAAPASGALVRNLDESGNDGSILLTAGQAIGFAGGGLDFSAITAKPDGVTGPVAPLSDLWGGGAGLQYFLVCMYVKLPALADWNQSAGVVTMFNASNTTGGYSSDPELVNIGQVKASAGIAAMIFNRQKAINSTDQIQLNVDASHHGNLCQIAFWRNATEQRARIKGVTVTSPSSALATNAANAADFSAKQPRFGVGNPFSGFSSNPNWAKFRLYRGFIENLATSGRDPAAVLDADWARVVARGAFG